MHCGDAQFSTSSASITLRAVYVRDRITHVPASGTQVVLGFKYLCSTSSTRHFSC